MRKLYAVLLGGKIDEKSFMEDHKVVYVVALDELDARAKAKLKRQLPDVHVDWTELLDSVDWYKISLNESEENWTKTTINPEYSK